MSGYLDSPEHRAGDPTFYQTVNTYLVTAIVETLGITAIAEYVVMANSHEDAKSSVMKIRAVRECDSRQLSANTPALVGIRK